MNPELLVRLTEAWPELAPEVCERIVRFHALLAEENLKQNLTRMISPQDFIDGHVMDVKMLIESGLVDFTAMDLGSGAGVPGLLWALIRDNAPWVLAESERHKAEFLFRMVRELGLPTVRVVADRGENYLIDNSVMSIVARAVGPVERIYAWLEKCSTWNNLVLLKGPAWGAEWELFNQGRFRGLLELKGTKEYTVGAELKKRIIVKLQRVPRGTMGK